MTVNEAIAYIQRQLGYRTGQAAHIQTAIQQALMRIQADGRLSMPSFLQQEYSDAGFVTTAGTRTVAIPSAFLKEDELNGGLYIYDASLDDPYVELVRANPGYIRSFYTEQGQPETYGFQGSSIIFGPIPDATYELHWFAYFKDTETVAGDATNLWLTHRPFLIIGEAGLTIATANQSPAADFFSNLLIAERAGLEAKVIANEEAASSESMGGDD